MIPVLCQTPTQVSQSCRLVNTRIKNNTQIKLHPKFLTQEIGQDKTQPEDPSCSLPRESLPDEYRLLSRVWEEFLPSGLSATSGCTDGVVVIGGSIF